MSGDLFYQSRTWKWDATDPNFENEDVRRATTQKHYVVVNLGASYRPVKGLEIGLRLNNALDQEYRTDPEMNAWGAPRNVMATLRYELR